MGKTKIRLYFTPYNQQSYDSMPTVMLLGMVSLLALGLGVGGMLIRARGGKGEGISTEIRDISW